jgi:hypothetical protein
MEVAMTEEAFIETLAYWLKTKFLPAIFPKKSFVGFLGGAVSSVVAVQIAGKVLPMLGEGIEIDAEKLRKMAADGFEVAEVIPFDITPELIPQQFRAFIAPLLFDAAHPVIKCEFTQEDVNGLIDLFSTKTIKREVKL